jgi:Glycosyl transferases group 1
MMDILPTPPTRSLADAFDAVVMLTWSNWHTEPRSNRYHYATRFARCLPVVFVQPDAEGDTISAESVPGHAIDLLHVPGSYDLRQARGLERALAERGIRRPLLWIYNVYFTDFVARSPARLRIYHATEDYLSPPESVVIAASDVATSVRTMLRLSDLVVAVSPGVADSHVRYGGYDGSVVVLPNGCDFDFWMASGANCYQEPEGGRPVALYQGGINARLDFKLLTELVDCLVDWDFWFCGVVAEATHGWSDLLGRPNVRYFGVLDPAAIAELARRARVGLIPFKQEGLLRRSLPLKAYEYVACGLPVVSIPIDALAVHGELFHTAADSIEFVRAIQALASTRNDPTLVERRLAIARAQSYDVRFERLTEVIATKLASPPAARSQLNILMLYDDQSTNVHTIKEHLEAFARYSHHRYYFLPATGLVPGIDDMPTKPDLGIYDAIIVHYSVRVSMEAHLSPGIAELVTAYAGPKVLFIQDEYDRTETARRWIERLGIDAVFTNVPLDELDKVYPQARFRHVDFLPTLTGYVPEDPILERYVMRLAERKVMIGYRGRTLPYQYGQLGQEKYLIGVEMKRLAEEAGLVVDIEIDDGKRIYGADWYRFLGSCRATLGTESGTDVFDDDGSLAELAKTHADMPYSDFAATYLDGQHKAVRMNQISPKVFEAIRLRTALILFDGSYSGVVQPHCHFIPLRKDFSNVDEVFAKITDLTYIEELTNRAFDQIIATGRYSYAAFVEGVDRYLETRSRRSARAVIVGAPVLQRFNHCSEFQRFAPISPLLVDTVLGSTSARRSDLMAPAEQLPVLPEAPTRITMTALARRIWRLIPTPQRHWLARRVQRLVADRERGQPLSSGGLLLHLMWRLLPSRVREGVLSHFR